MLKLSRKLVRSWAKRVGLFVLMCGFFFVFFEGLAGTSLLIYHLAAPSPGISQSAHTRYDPDLGWSGMPNVYVRDMYGPGVYLRTNSRGFRSNEETDATVPAGKFRIICSGDSFTLGFGVDNDHAWCQQLSSLDARLQTVNMGQGGYGTDQAYLWYMRDARSLDHHAQIFAIIGPDLLRVREASFLGHGKPLLSIRDGKLSVTNVPAPRRPLAVWLAKQKDSFSALSVVRLLTHLQTEDDLDLNAWIAGQREVVSKMLASLRSANDAKKSILLLMYLPIMRECQAPQISARSRQTLNEEAQRLGILFLDLTADCGSVPASRLNAMFGFGRHYSVEGNAFVAAAVHRWLLARPEITARLAQIAPQE